MTLALRAQEVERRVLEACARSGRKREDVRIVAVTKYVSAWTAAEVVRLGVKEIGENRWPDARGKWELLRGQAVFHYIGSLQTNKVKDVVGKFDFIHSLDRLSLAEEIDRRARLLGITVNCYLQVNVSGEQTKHGLAPEETGELLNRLRGLPGIRPVGLMTMAPHEADAEKTRPVFRALRELRDALNDRGLADKPLEGLSMGMSNDFEVAIEEGATVVRLGTVLVGREQQQD